MQNACQDWRTIRADWESHHLTGPMQQLEATHEFLFELGRYLNGCFLIELACHSFGNGWLSFSGQATILMFPHLH